jgi:hypothetical protein
MQTPTLSKEEIEMNRTLRTRKMLAAIVALIALSVAATAHAAGTQQTAYFDTDSFDHPYGVAFVTLVDSTPSSASLVISGSTRPGNSTYVEVRVNPFFNPSVTRVLALNSAPATATQSDSFSERRSLSWAGGAFFITARFCRDVPNSSDVCTSTSRLYLSVPTPPVPSLP